MDEQVRSGLSANSVRRVRATLRSALSMAVRDGLVVRNVAALSVPPRVTAKSVRAVSEDQARLILAAVKGHRLEPLFVLAMATGLRQGELLGLRWSDIDLDGRFLTVSNALQRVRGQLVLVEPKSASSHRTLPLTALSLSALRSQQVCQATEAEIAGDSWTTEELVFTTEWGRPLDGSSVTHQFQRALRDVDGLPWLRFHDLRHACASLLLSQGVGMREVMEQLGHSQISLTMNTYTHVQDGALREAADRIDALLTGDSAP